MKKQSPHRNASSSWQVPVLTRSLMMPALEGPQNGSSLSSSPGPILKAQPRHIVAALAYCSACRPHKSFPTGSSAELFAQSDGPLLPWHAQMPSTRLQQ